MREPSGAKPTRGAETPRSGRRWWSRRKKGRRASFADDEKTSATERATDGTATAAMAQSTAVQAKAEAPASAKSAGSAEINAEDRASSIARARSFARSDASFFDSGGWEDEDDAQRDLRVNAVRPSSPE